MNDVAVLRRRALLALLAVGVLAPAVLAAARWPSYWLWIASEATPMTWLQSVVLVLAAAASLVVAALLRLRGRLRAQRRPWAVLAAGFGALAVDERFALHERVRDGVLAPRDVRLPLLTWIAPGDFLVLLMALGGLVLVPLVLRALADDRAARRLLAAGIALAAVAVGVDSVDPSTWTVEAERLQQSLEEVVELAAGLCLLGAVVLRLLGLMAPDAELPADVADVAALPAAPSAAPQAGQLDVGTRTPAR